MRDMDFYLAVNGEYGYAKEGKGIIHYDDTVSGTIEWLGDTRRDFSGSWSYRKPLEFIVPREFME